MMLRPVDSESQFSINLHCDLGWLRYKQIIVS